MAFGDRQDTRTCQSTIDSLPPSLCCLGAGDLINLSQGPCVLLNSSQNSAHHHICWTVRLFPLPLRRLKAALSSARSLKLKMIMAFLQRLQIEAFEKLNSMLRSKLGVQKKNSASLLNLPLWSWKEPSVLNFLRNAP